MFDLPETEKYLCETVEVLATRVAGLEQVASEPGLEVSHINPSTSELIELTLLRTVAALRRLRNSRRPVNKLPPEILSHIFSFVHHSGDNLVTISYQFGLRTAGDPLTLLIPLLSVCSRWRSIVTTSSFLWSMIDNRNALALAISSKYRPVNGPLDVHLVDNFLRPAGFDYGRDTPPLPVFHHYNPSLAHVLRNEGYRVREFFVQSPSTLLPALMDFPGESLRVCELWLSQSEHAPGETVAIRPLFQACTPNLRSLVIGNLLFIPSNHFPSLTRLILSNGGTPIPFGRSFTFMDFMLLLSRCPNLQVLHLFDIDVIGLHELPDDRILASVNLQHLRKFSNNEVPFDQTGGQRRVPYLGPRFRRALLTHIHLSPDCVIRLATILPEDLERTLGSLPFDSPFTSVYLGAHDPRFPIARGINTGTVEPECVSIMATDTLRQRGVRIDFQMPGTRYRALSTAFARARVRDVVRRAPLLSAVHELCVAPAANTLLSEPDSLLPAFPNLTTLVLVLVPDPLMLPRLVASVDGVTDMRAPSEWEALLALEVRDDDMVIPCPRLRTLCVFGFTERQAMLLYSVVLSRGEAGYPIRRLVVMFSQPPEDSVLELLGGLWGLVEDFTLIRFGGKCPDDLLWEHRLPPVCRDRSEHSALWPAWF